jgi:hypothetical protein
MPIGASWWLVRRSPGGDCTRSGVECDNARPGDATVSRWGEAGFADDDVSAKGSLGRAAHADNDALGREYRVLS